MSKIFVRKSANGNYMIPADAQSEKFIMKMQPKSTYSFESKKARNPKFHRLAFGLANVVCQNSDWSDPYLFIKAVMLTHGLCEPLMDTLGEVHMQVKSIAFENMDDAEFSKVFDAELIEAARIMGMNPKELDDKLEEVLSDYGY